ncbi:ribulokinase [Christensenella tenuis]|uniref:Ribulokinase n=1 Tax=Christensenella tenuis TaxID=2763033 RepID=A0ABR7EDW1_9FIRM|nr:ribulokinase [Christensenella tenuis]MBC5647965.1 ribulokinase [Christensenella tenuis]
MEMPTSERGYVLGADFGSDSVRAVVVDLTDGSMCAEAVCTYPRWINGLYQLPEEGIFRQHPADYLEALETVAAEALGKAGDRVRKAVRGIAVDTTGSTPCPVDRAGTPLALTRGFEEDTGAMFHLWKDHAAVNEAEEINRVLSDWHGLDYTKYQGVYSSEWYWAKILRTSRLSEKIREAAFSWVEHCDWITGELAGNTDPLTMYRCSCAAGHKALWHSEWDGLPDAECLGSLDPALKKAALNFGRNVKPAGTKVGMLCKKWAERLGLPAGVAVGGCSFDAHAGAVGAGVRERILVANLGTSAVDMMIERAERLPTRQMAYACGMAEDSILPGYMGIEAGQSAFGDVYAWLKRFLIWPSEQFGDEKTKRELSEKLLGELTRQAEALDIGSALPALDWFNGRRYPYADESARGAIAGLSLGTEPPQVFQSLVLATAFGWKRIIDSLSREGLAIETIIAVGGIAQKSPYVMQTMADALERPIYVSASAQACARGAAVFAAAACGAYSDIFAAQEAICEGYVSEYVPNTARKRSYAEAFRRYCRLGESVR